MGSRKFLVGAFFVVLQIWGPIDHSWPAWLPIRIGYLIVLPLAAWFLLKWIWGVWQPDPVIEKRLERTLGGVTATRAGTATPTRRCRQSSRLT